MVAFLVLTISRPPQPQCPPLPRVARSGGGSSQGMTMCVGRWMWIWGGRRHGGLGGSPPTSLGGGTMLGLHGEVLPTFCEVSTLSRLM